MPIDGTSVWSERAQTWTQASTRVVSKSLYVPTYLCVLVHAPVHCASYTYTHTQTLPDAQGSEIARGQDHRSPLALHRRSSALLYRYREVRVLTELHSKSTSHFHTQSCTQSQMPAQPFSYVYTRPSGRGRARILLHNEQCCGLPAEEMSTRIIMQGMKRHIFLRWWVRAKDFIRLRRRGLLGVRICL